MAIKYLYLGAVAAIVGCASGSGDTARGPAPRAGSYLSGQEIAAAHADNSNLYDAIARLRPNWLAPHGITSGQNNGAGTEYAVVYVDGQSYGDLNTLRGIPAYQAGAIQYYDVTQAGGRFGIRAGSSGVIDVTIKSAKQ
jgi:hypothetical protein